MTEKPMVASPSPVPASLTPRCCTSVIARNRQRFSSQGVRGPDRSTEGDRQRVDRNTPRGAQGLGAFGEGGTSGHHVIDQDDLARRRPAFPGEGSRQRGAPVVAAPADLGTGGVDPPQ